METNPYAPPKAAVADVSPTGLKRRSVILMILLTIVTFGLYVPIWFLRRRAALNRLDSPRKLRLWPFVIAVTWSVFDFIVGIAAGSAPLAQAIGEGAAVHFGRFAVGILMLVQSFFNQGHPGRPSSWSGRPGPKSAVGRHREAVWSDDVVLPEFLSTARNKSVHRWLEIEGRLIPKRHRIYTSGIAFWAHL